MNARRAGLVLALACAGVLPSVASGAEPPAPAFQRDRGPGVTTSLFGTYVREGQWLLYPFLEYEKKTKDEYHGSELGYAGETDYLGKSTARQMLLFVAFGVAQDIALEFEAALYERATLQRAADDTTSGIPERIEESGFGAMEAQVRWRFAHETERSAEWFSFLEIGIPSGGDRVLIGNSDWEAGLGFGAVKGFGWGTITARVSLAYDAAEGAFEMGEYAIEYLRKVSETWSVVATIEGEEDEVAVVGELQWRLSDHAFAKINLGVGVTGQAADVAPEVGVMFTF